MRGLRLSQLARDDIGGIWDYVAAENLRSADRVLLRFDARLKVLRQFPETGVARPDIDQTARMLVEHPYVIVYRGLPDVVQIVRVLHGARNIASLRFNDELE
jgi:toxin ParE1/3/4